MLTSLAIRNMVLIEAADLDFRPGLNVLTGETGAGKSILLDSLGFVLGWRTRSGLVREGADQGEVTAAFRLAPGHPARGVLSGAGFPVEDDLILRRVTGADGRRQAWINDRRATAETVRGLSDTLVELHGQQDDRGLLDPKGHRALLDAYLGDVEPLAGVRAAWTSRVKAAETLEAARAELERAARDAEYLAHAVAELDVLDPQPGEEPELDARRRNLQAAGRIREDVARAAEALGPDGAEGPLIQAMRWLEDASAKADGLLDPALEGVSRALSELGEALGTVETALEGLHADPGELDRVEERLFAIRAAARKHQVPPDALPDLAADLRARLRALESGAADISRLESEAAAAEKAYTAAAATLTAARQDAAGRLDTAMAEELPPLKLGRAVFRTELTLGDSGPDGADRVRFTAATNPGAATGPIDRVASGGELSRFLLALKVCLSARSENLTLIFDEIDRGVGGATADAVGRRLQALGETAQILVVTHSPQVAARGAHHWRVGKTVTKGVTRTEVTGLGPEARIEEIARMLAGDTVTDEARAAARALAEV